MSYFLLIAYLKMSCLLFFLRIYDVIKIIVMTCFSLIAYLKMTCFLLFLRIRNNYDDIFFANCVFENDILCISYYITFINIGIKIIGITSPFNKIFIFVFSNNFFYDIYFRSIFSFLQFFFIENTIYYFII